ncbi:CopD family protein [Qipengyuania spongiae]|uniref:Protoporphyrinogen IX oxidase n=1 Tax=Qipengyuania spongiae TaxID=2909673 RepID=A0ABY5SYC2_9SPHN|nr:CopD family protein [Qipengyuania spongiae]UVI39538.1 CopD family protein [Qipengyuania spongiae]
MILSLVKAIHIAALIIWCAGLVGLPLMLSKHEIGENQASYSQLRLLTHRAYSYFVTPAAIIAIAAGTALIFIASAFTLWMFVKLLAVGVLVSLHAWIGHLVVLMSERRGRYAPRSALPTLLPIMIAMVAILFLVLGKPALESFAPAWLARPLGHELPVDETPI